MTGHDPLCRAQHMAVETDIDDLDGCDCALIARVRADERRIQHDGRECVCARTEADTEANLRERIAQEYAARHEEAKRAMRERGYDAYLEGQMDAYDNAARIARGDS